MTGMVTGGTDHTNGRTRRRPAELRSLIVEAAEETFGQLGYTDATMVVIAQRAGVTRSVLTRHFATKADLFRCVMTEPFLEFIGGWMYTWTAKLDVQRSEEELVHEFVADLYRNTLANSGALKLLMFHSDQLDSELRQQVWATLNEGLAAVVDIADREFSKRQYPTADLNITIRAILSMVMGYVTLDPSLLADCIADDERIVTHLSSLILHGMTLGRGGLS